MRRAGSRRFTYYWGGCAEYQVQAFRNLNLSGLGPMKFRRLADLALVPFGPGRPSTPKISWYWQS
jgi:hypothetical protein